MLSKSATLTVDRLSLTPQLYHRFTDLADRLFDETLSLEDLTKIHQQLPIHSKQDIALSGNDVMQLFPERKRGRWIGHILDQLEEKIITGELPNQREQLKEWVIWSYPIEKKSFNY